MYDKSLVVDIRFEVKIRRTFSGLGAFYTFIKNTLNRVLQGQGDTLCYQNTQNL